MPPFGPPRDVAQWLALALALAMVVAGPRLLRPGRARPLLVALAALTAAALSAAYVAVYLRGGPRIIDATSYYLEARALSEGSLSWPLATPETAVLGRFLVRSSGAHGPHVAVIFPPGYPLLLALGFLARAPLAVGPVLAAAITVATWDLARRITGAASTSPAAPTSTSPAARSSAFVPELAAQSSAFVPELAALFSVVCAALRYHSADTMSHGLAALAATSALTLGFRAVDALDRGAARRAGQLAAGAGLAAGWLAATRPISAGVVALTLTLALVSAAPATDRRARARVRLVALAAVAALPGLVLLFAHQRAATGAFGLSSQRAYYAAADGPPDCFRYGFGPGIGCIGEHGDFVAAHLGRGYGALAAIGTTLRRLKQHLVDPLNAEPLAVLVVIGVVVAIRTKGSRARLLALAIGAQIAAYAPFYFDGNYPAGGARFFADVLPFEHVLAALAVAAIAARFRSPARLAALAPALALAGFAVRAGFDHAMLRDREGGRPMFEPSVLAAAGVDRGLVFVDTDHGFNLAFDPAASVDAASSAQGIEVARYHGDGVDRLLWAERGQPPAYRYRFDFQPGNAPARASVEPLTLAPLGDEPLVIEAESLVPARAQRDGWAFAEYASGTCASAGRWVALHHASATKPPQARIGVPGLPGGGMLAPWIALGPGARGSLTLEAEGALLHRWPIDAGDLPAGAPRCVALPATALPLRAHDLELILEAELSPGAIGVAPIIALDRVDLTRAKTIDRR